MVNKITWRRAGGVTEPGRYMFTFGWLTVTEKDLAIWQQFPDASFTLVELPAQVRESSEQVLSAARKAGNLYLDSYEKAVDRTTELQLKLAGLSQQEWLKSLIEAQVDVTRELAGSYTTTARSLLK